MSSVRPCEITTQRTTVSAAVVPDRHERALATLYRAIVFRDSDHLVFVVLLLVFMRVCPTRCVHRCSRE